MLQKTYLKAVDSPQYHSQMKLFAAKRSLGRQWLKEPKLSAVRIRGLMNVFLLYRQPCCVAVATTRAIQEQEKL